MQLELSSAHTVPAYISIGQTECDRTRPHLAELEYKVSENLLSNKCLEGSAQSSAFKPTRPYCIVISRTLQNITFNFYARSRGTINSELFFYAHS